MEEQVQNQSRDLENVSIDYAQTGQLSSVLLGFISRFPLEVKSLITDLTFSFYAIAVSDNINSPFLFFRSFF